MTSLRICSCLGAIACLVLLAAPLSAAITPVGDVTPPLPWTSSITVRIGDGDIGGLTIDAGSMLTTQQGTLGYSQFGMGAATITGSGSEWTNTGLLYVGRDGLGVIDVESGGKLTSSATHVGYSSQSIGMATISGVGSQWSNYDQLNVGGSGSGTVVIEAGGQISTVGVTLGLNPDSIGSAIVTGAGSKWTKSIGSARRNELLVGGSGSGTLIIEAGGQVSTESSYLGAGSDSTGIATITGAGSNWTNSSLYVGSTGNGTLTIEAGGQVSTGFGYIGRNSSSTGTATVTGAGSKWTNHASLEIGRSGSGTLTVADGGMVEATKLFASLSDLAGNGMITATQGAILDADLVFDATHGTQQDIPFGSGGTLTVNWNSGTLGVGYKQEGSLMVSEGRELLTEYGYLGYRDGSTGTAVVSGAGTRWTNSISLDVGNDGTGILMIEEGGQVTSADGYLGSGCDTCTGTAMVTGVGSQWINSGSFFVGHTSGGTLAVEAGGQVSSTTGYVGRYSDSTGTVTLTGPNSKWMNDGYLYVGDDGSGSLAISGGALVTAGALTIDTDSDGDSFINMATGGMLALFGNADDTLAQFLDLVQGTDAIRYWDASLADWSPLTAAMFGVDYTLEYLTTGDLVGYTLLTVGRVGDFDNDGDVDGRDFLAWQRNPELGSLADWQNAYGGGSLSALRLPPSALNLTVPEPSCLVLLLGLMLLSRRGRA